MTTKQIEYFGTSTTVAGHYMWKFDEHGMHSNGLNLKHLPFNPESFPKEYYEKGNIEFHQVQGWSLIAIAGSPKDNRAGTKAVFMLNELITAQEMYDCMILNPFIVKILDAFPFLVHYKRIINRF